jgi:hypothetical protein
MSILTKIDKIINESGIRNIKELTKKYKEAEIYFHVDLDGVTSAIGMKTYLKKYGIKTVDAHPIQYGDSEFSPPKPKKNTLHVLVDFAHGKPTMHIHTDHHDKQAGVATGTSVSFVHTPSNAAYISQVLSPNDLFPPKDAKIISTVDSADFLSQGLTPIDIMRIVFKVDKSKSVKINHQMMGFATNKLVLAHKNKKDFLSDLVLQANPSLQSIYTTTLRLAKEAGYRPPDKLERDQEHYIVVQREKSIGPGAFRKIKALKSGQNVVVAGNILVQYGGGSMGKGNLYDRYTPFKNHPEADVLVLMWPMGLLQASFNPFKKIEKKFHIGNLVMKNVMTKYKSKMDSKDISLGNIKRQFEKSSISGSMGFTFNDVVALFEDKVKGLKGKPYWEEMVKDITNKPYKSLSFKQKKVLDKVTITFWDLVMSQSGGHPSITNITNLNFYGKDYTKFMKEIAVDVAKALAKEMK